MDKQCEKFGNVQITKLSKASDVASDLSKQFATVPAAVEKWEFGSCKWLFDKKENAKRDAMVKTLDVAWIQL